MYVSVKPLLFAFAAIGIVSAQVTTGLPPNPPATVTPTPTPTPPTPPSPPITSVSGSASSPSGSASSSNSGSIVSPSGSLTTSRSNSISNTSNTRSVVSSSASSSSTNPVPTFKSPIKKKKGSPIAGIAGILAGIFVAGAGILGIWWKRRKSAKKGVPFNHGRLESGKGVHEALPLTSNVGGHTPVTATPYSDAPYHGDPNSLYAQNDRASLSNAALVAPSGMDPARGPVYGMNDNPYAQSNTSINQGYHNPYEQQPAYNPTSGYSYPGQPGQTR